MESLNDTIRRYILKVLNNKIFKKSDKIYVELRGRENFNDIDLFEFEMVDENELLPEMNEFNGSPHYEDLPDDDTIKKNTRERRIDDIIKIANDTRHLELVGQPGSGKTMTLLKILYNNAKLALQGGPSQKIPFYIHANEFRTDNTFLDILSNEINREWVSEQLARGQLQLLIDGLNEIADQYKREAYEEINFLLTEYAQNSVIISERKVNFERRFDIPVFELIDLNESQIHSFIKNYAGEYFDEIWRQLKRKKDMLQLACSPLTLKMILSVSKCGIIPQNRGLLYHHFVHSLLQREKGKWQQVNVDIKQDVLSFIAFEMRKAGYVSLPIAKFKNLIGERLAQVNSTTSPNLLYNEVINNLIIQRSQNKQITFFHETYQEYFCAVQLKSLFEASGELNIDLKEKSWFEALLMCSELVSDDHAVPFFKYIYKDQKEKRQESTSKSKGIISFLIPFHKEQKEEEGQKPIQWLTPSDFNEDIDIACKIAWQIKPFRPNIYELAERYLCNYLIIWKYLFYEKHIHAMPIEKLFAAVASLNSRKLIHYIINEPGWAYIWLYSDYEDHHNTFLLKMIDPEKEEQAQKISSTICTNIPNFINFYEVINHSIDEYRFSRPMHRRLKLLKLNLLKSQSENQLWEYYHDHPDFDVFLAILKINLNAITEYNFSENSIFNNTAVLKTLINYHITKEPAQRVLLDELATFAYDENLIHRVVEKLFKTDQRECLFTFMEFLLENNTTVYNEHIPVLQAIPFFLLSEKLQNQFIKFDNCGQVPYHGLHGTKLIVNSTLTD